MEIKPPPYRRQITLREYWQMHFDGFVAEASQTLGPIDKHDEADIRRVMSELEPLVLAEAKLEPLFVLETMKYGLEVPNLKTTFEESFAMLMFFLFGDEARTKQELKKSLPPAQYWAYEGACGLIHGFKTGDVKLRQHINERLNSEYFPELFWDVYYPIFKTRVIELLSAEDDFDDY